ncbi:MAG: DMT family transporter, partial [Bacteroidota bacterium]
SGKTISLSGSYFAGNLFTLVAAMMWGSYTAFSRPVTSKIDPMILIIAGLLFAFPLNLGIAIPYFEQIDWSIVTFSVWAAILYSGGLSTGIAVAIWIIVVKRVGATHTAVFGNLVPLVALIGGYLLLGESITLLQIIGGGLILGGLLIMRRDRTGDSKSNTESNTENEAD